MNFRKLLDDIREEMTSGDIASVDTKLGTKMTRNVQKGKKCKAHKRLNCLDCTDKDYNESD